MSFYCLRGTRCGHLDSVFPVVLPSLEACLRELTQFFWGGKVLRCISAESCCWFVLVRAQSCSFMQSGRIREGIVVQKSRDSLVSVRGTL